MQRPTADEQSYTKSKEAEIPGQWRTEVVADVMDAE
jgi:hypothetical protein